jgi:peptidoglycan hydrolase-like protein with peptidoglycan-binding domain
VKIGADVVVTPPIVTPPPVAVVTPPPTNPAQITDSTVITAGAPDDWARLVQRLLIKAGYSQQTVNGGYGTTTTGNVKDFQSKHSLTVTGDVDEATLDRLIG